MAITSPAFAADDSPKFEAADAHASTSRPNAALRVQPGRGGRYEVQNASMVDLIRVAYGYTSDKKQLGLKLEKRKRTVEMVVIDHLEQKPTAN